MASPFFVSSRRSACTPRSFLPECFRLALAAYEDHPLPRVDYRQLDSSPPSSQSRSVAAWFADRPQMPYLIPLMAYLLIMSPATFGHLGGIDWETLWRNYHPLIYFTQNAVAAVLLWCFWDYYAKIRWTHLAPRHDRRALWDYPVGGR